jgi:hypothetical protein
MKPASINEIKQELNTLGPKRLIELCLRLAKYKKENKELLGYLLFEAHNEQAFVGAINKETDEKFSELPKATTYLTTKSLRKILRSITKYSRYYGFKRKRNGYAYSFLHRLKKFWNPHSKKTKRFSIYITGS